MQSNFQIWASILKPAMAGLQKVFIPVSSKPIQSYVRFQCDDTGSLRIQAHDLVATVTFHCRIKTTKAFDFLFEGTQLLKILETIDEDSDLTFQYEDQRCIHLTYHSHESLKQKSYSVPLPRDWPDSRPLPQEAMVLEPKFQEELVHALAMSSQESSQLFEGILFDAAEMDGCFWVGATAHILSTASSERIILKAPIFVPSHPFFGCKGFGREGNWQLTTGPDEKKGNQIRIRSKHWTFQSRSMMANDTIWKKPHKGEGIVFSS